MRKGNVVKVSGADRARSGGGQSQQPAEACLALPDRAKPRLKRGVFCSVVDLQAAITASLTMPTMNQSPSSGLPTPTKSLPPSTAGSKC
jgi:hypothetical protein